jgi:hypothetical protein
MRRVKIFYLDKEITEITVPKEWEGIDISCYINCDLFDDPVDITHFKVFYRNEWMYGNEYSFKRKKNGIIISLKSFLRWLMIKLNKNKE